MVLSQPQASRFAKGGELTVVFDGGWDHNPGNSEVRLALTFEHLDNERVFTMACCRAAGLSSFSEAEQVNGAETRAVQKAKLKDAVCSLTTCPFLQQRCLLCGATVCCQMPLLVPRTVQCPSSV